MSGKLRCLALAGGAIILLWFPSARADNGCFEKIQNKCTTCHYPTRICNHIGKYSRDDWEETVNLMRRYGLQLTKAQENAIIDCLEGMGEKDRAELCR